LLCAPSLTASRFGAAWLTRLLRRPVSITFSAWHTDDATWYAHLLVNEQIEPFSFLVFEQNSHFPPLRLSIFVTGILN
jgi:hypothetical protein